MATWRAEGSKVSKLSFFCNFSISFNNILSYIYHVHDWLFYSLWIVLSGLTGLSPTPPPHLQPFLIAILISFGGKFLAHWLSHEDSKLMLTSVFSVIWLIWGGGGCRVKTNAVVLIGKLLTCDQLMLDNGISCRSYDGRSCKRNILAIYCCIL